MTELETFGPRTRLACCGTCRAWGLRRRGRASITWCPTIGVELPDDLEACGCAAWVKEPRETFALQLYDELVKAGVA